MKRQLYTQEQSGKLEELLGKPASKLRDRLLFLKPALYGILSVWLLVIVAAAIGWMFRHHPETAITILIITVVTSVGALLGMAAKYG